MKPQSQRDSKYRPPFTIFDPIGLQVDDDTIPTRDRTVVGFGRPTVLHPFRLKPSVHLTFRFWFVSFGLCIHSTLLDLHLHFPEKKWTSV